MRIARTVLTLAVALLFASTLLAQDQPKRGDRRGGGPGPQVNEFILKAVESLNLTAEQKEKFEKIKKDAAELAKKRDGLLTQEQKDARDKAVADAKAAGKTGRDLFRAGMEAVKLTDEQRAKNRELMAEGSKLFQSLQNLLTDEQKKELRAKMPQRGERKKTEN